jgi:hypothetical protein
VVATLGGSIIFYYQYFREFEDKIADAWTFVKVASDSSKQNMKIGPIVMSLYNQMAAFAFLKLFFTVRIQDAFVPDSYL